MRNPIRPTALRALAAVCLFAGGSGPVPAQTYVQKTIATNIPVVNALSLNDNGWVTWAAGPSTTSQVFVYDGTNTTQAGLNNHTNRGARINNNNRVVFDASENLQGGGQGPAHVYLWTPTSAATRLSGAFANGSSPDINNLDQIAWHGQQSEGDPNDIFFLDSNGSPAVNVTIAFEQEASSSHAQINDNGQISWERLYSTPESRNDIVLADLADPSAFVTLNQNATDTVYNGDLNNAGQAVWVERNETTGVYDVFFRDPGGAGTPVNLTENITGDPRDAFQNNPEMNEAGTVVWFQNVGGGARDLYWTVNGAAEKITLSPGVNNKPIAINDVGQFAYAYNTGSGWNINLVTAVPGPGALPLFGAGLAAGAASLRARRRGAR